MWFFPQFSAMWNWFVSCKEVSFEIFWTWILLEKKHMFCWKHVNPPQVFQKSYLFPQDFLQPFVSQYVWLLDMIWVGLLEDQFFPKHHHWLNIMRIWQLDTLAHYIQIISFGYFFINLCCFPKQATEKPRKNWLPGRFSTRLCASTEFSEHRRGATTSRSTGTLRSLGCDFAGCLSCLFCELKNRWKDENQTELKKKDGWEIDFLSQKKGFHCFLRGKKAMWSKIWGFSKDISDLLVRSIHYGCNCSYHFSYWLRR